MNDIKKINSQDSIQSENSTESSLIAIENLPPEKQKEEYLKIITEQNKTIIDKDNIIINNNITIKTLLEQLHDAVKINTTLTEENTRLREKNSNLSRLLFIAATAIVILIVISFWYWKLNGDI